MLNFGDGTYCNIEIQLVNKGNFIKRFLFYWARIFSSFLKEGEDYETLPRTISIAILDFNLKELKDIPDFYTSWNIIEEKYREKILTSVFDFRIIELPKLLKSSNKQLHDKCTQWMLFLNNPKSMEVEKIMRENTDIQKAIDTLHEISSDEELMRIIELREKAARDEISYKHYLMKEFNLSEEELKMSRIKFEQSQKEAEASKLEMEELKKEIEKSKLEVETSKAEIQHLKEKSKKAREEAKYQKSIEIAKKLLENNMDLDTIQKITGLSKEELQKQKIL